MSENKDKHIECVADFCGNHKLCGYWADIYERENGSKYVELGGGWSFYAESTPKTIEETDENYSLFLKACEEGQEVCYAETNWK